MSTPWTFPVIDLSADTRRALPVFQISPNWKDGVTETLSWLTDVMSSEQAVEQRRALRRFPRRTFEYGFMRAGTNRARIDNFLGGVGKREHLVPIWHEQFSLPGTHGSDGSVQFPAGSLAEREFAVGDLVMITTLDADRYAVLTVTAVNETVDQAQLHAGANVGIWPAGSRIVPLRRARMLDDPVMDNPSDRVGTARMRWTLLDADSRWAPSWGYCSPLWRTKPDRKSPLGLTYNRSDYLVDNTVGTMSLFDPGDRAQISETMDIKLFGRTANWAFRQFLYNARGRARRFYVPTFLNDIEPLGTTLSGTEFEAKPNGFSDYYDAPQEARQIIGIDFSDGRPSIYRTISGIAAVPGTVAPYRPAAEAFVLTEPLPPIEVRDIERVSFIVPARFDQDVFEIFHPTADCVVCSSSLVTRSAVVEGMPPIECWVTSRPYPVESIDSMAPAVTLVEGQFYTGIANVPETEAMTSNATLVDGVFTLLLTDVSAGTDSMSSSATLIDGELKGLLTAYDAGAESIQSGATLIDGDIRVALLSYTVPEESIGSSLTLLEGTLS